jgi:hypothetical protein
LSYNELCEGKSLKNRGIKLLLVWALTATVFLSGCSGVLFETKGDGGKAESLKLDSGEGWESYDNHPRNPFDRKNSNDEMSIMLKSVKTF